MYTLNRCPLTQNINLPLFYPHVVPKGYYFTEDMACLDGDGNCRILGREVDVINCHGERILGRVDIEDALVSG